MTNEQREFWSKVAQKYDRVVDLQIGLGTRSLVRERMAHDGSRWVVLKGGHLPGSDAVDVVTDGDRMIELGAKRIDTKNTHGTGCTLSAAIAALLPVSPDASTAIRRAKDYLVAALAAGGALDVGRGHGPVHHFHALWQPR